MQPRVLFAFLLTVPAPVLGGTAPSPQERVLPVHTGEVTSVDFHPGGKMLATASVDGTVRYWDLADGKFLKSLAAHSGGAYAALFTPDGKQLATCGADGSIRI